MPTASVGFVRASKETTTDPATGQIQKVVVYTISSTLISQTTTPSTNGSPGAPQTLVFGYDGHGSVRVLLDMAAAIATVANIQQLFHYDAYGNLLNLSAAQAATSILYSGQMLDSGTALYYNRARWYDSQTGRFNSLDPFFGNLQDPESLHKYLYAADDPVGHVDPTGQVFGLAGSLVVSGLQSAGRGLSNAASYVTLRAAIYMVRFANLVLRLQAWLANATFYVQYGALWILTHLPEIEAGITIGSVAVEGISFILDASVAWLEYDGPISSNQFERGRQLEDATGANLRGNVMAIDDFRNGTGTSVKTHDVASSTSLRYQINKDLKALENIQDPNTVLTGYDADGNLVTIRGSQIQRRALLVGIPWNSRNWLSPTFRQWLANTVRQTNVTIRVVPIWRWRR